MQAIKNIIQKWNSISLVKRIICGLIIGIILGLAVPQASGISILGDLFVGALRGIAPVLATELIKVVIGYCMVRSNVWVVKMV